MRQGSLCTTNQNIRLDTRPRKFLHRMLRGLCFQLFGSTQIGYQSQMNDHTIHSSQLPFQLSNCLYIRQGFDIAHCPTKLGYHNIKLTRIAKHEHPPLDLIRHMRNHLYRLSKIIATTLFLNHCLVNSARCHIVDLSGRNIQKPLIMPQIKIRLRPIFGDIALPMFVRI